MNLTWTRSPVRRSVALMILGLAAMLGIGGCLVRSPDLEQSHTAPPAEAVANPPAAAQDEDGPVTLDFPRESWEPASLEMRPAERSSLVQTVELTGKIALNEDRVAHVFPLVEGRVDDVKIQLGDKVRKGDLLVVVQSKEVGQAMLQLYQDRLQRDFAVTKDRWTQTVAENTLAMIQLMRDGAPIEEIEKQLTNRPMGEYRDRLMTAYISHFKSQRILDRLTPLSSGGAVAGKQLLEAEAEWNAARSTLQSLLEQIQQDALQAAKFSEQAVKEYQTRVAVDETNLKILGFDDAALAAIDPTKQGEAISHYPIYSPFDGTIISKDVVLLERVGPESQILSIADLSTVWVTTDIYEEHLPLLEKLGNQKVRFRSNAWPGKTFEAQVFYTGDVVDESTRTLAMRAVADNAEGLLKPGMFVNVELPRVAQDDVLQVPEAALQEYEGKTFVFVHLHDETFERRDVTPGRRAAQSVEILSGLKPGEMVVTRGGFALKSRMLADLLSDD